MTSDLTSATEFVRTESMGTEDFTSICSRIRDRAAVDPDGIAAVDAAGVLTFAELVRRASLVAARLQGAGVVSGSCVGLFMDRSPEFVVAACGILWAGAAYLPVDTANPSNRVEYVLAHAGVSTVVTSGRAATRLPTGSWRTLISDGSDSDVAEASAPLVPVAQADLAYVIYTSGSTGQPKGVELTHGNLANLIDWHVAAFGVGPRDRASQVASLGFDAAVWELWPHLAAGAAVNFADDATRRSPQMLRDWLLAEEITISFVPTVLAEQLIYLSWPKSTALRTLLTGADVLHRRPAGDLPFRLVNNYGPTECTVVATSGVVAPDSVGYGAPSIGRPIANSNALILDSELRAVPPGEPGELCLAGALVGRGYRNDPELTARQFVTVVHPGRGEMRVYRTGDQVRQLENGEIAFLGRLDSQVKIRGFRIEPAEIVASLDRFPGVSASAVVALAAGDETDPGAEPVGEPELVAYVVTAAAAVTAPNLRAFLAAQLPEYMIPSMFVAVDALPLNLNGKLDVSALPVPAKNNLLPGQVDPTRNLGDSVEEEIAEMVRTLIDLPGVDSQENIFLVGGHSMFATQLVLRIRQAFDVKLSLRQVFAHPTVAGLAAEVTARMASVEVGGSSR